MNKRPNKKKLKYMSISRWAGVDTALLDQGGQACQAGQARGLSIFIASTAKME